MGLCGTPIFTGCVVFMTWALSFYPGNILNMGFIPLFLFSFLWGAIVYLWYGLYVGYKVRFQCDHNGHIEEELEID